MQLSRNFRGGLRRSKRPYWREYEHVNQDRSLSCHFRLLRRAAARATNLLTNGDLEVTAGQLTANPALLYPDGLIHASSTINANVLTGWTIGAAAIDIVPTAYWQPSTGSYSVDLVGTSGIGSISQTVTGLAPGSTYGLTFDFSINPQTFDSEQTSTKILQVSAIGTDLTPTIFSGTAGTRTISNMQYLHEVLSFTATSSSATLTMAALMPTGLSSSFQPNSVYCGPVVDNLDLEFLHGAVQPPNGGPAVPEPAMPCLFAIGTTMLAGRQWMRQRAV